jgi:hypothetical protein
VKAAPGYWMGASQPPWARCLPFAPCSPSVYPVGPHPLWLTPPLTFCQSRRLERRAELTDEQIAAIRHYLAQWIYAPGFDGGEGVGLLRDTIGGLKSRQAIDNWLGAALEVGIDPL